MDLADKERRVAIEAIATLVHVKNTMTELLLRPAGVPSDVYRPLLYRRDSVSGRVLSKRQIAPLIIHEVETRPDCAGIVRRLVEIAANWSSYHLADDEYAARATVQLAREVLGLAEVMEAREAEERAAAKRDELARNERLRAELVATQLELLLLMFDDAMGGNDPQRRGYLLQDLLNRVFDLYGIPVVRSFVRNEGAEQIDGAFKLDGWHYLVECRWRKEPANIRDLDGLLGQVARSGKQTMGLFLSVNGWSDNVVPLLKQNREKVLLLMEGYDLRTVLTGQVDLQDFLLAKAAKLGLDAEPFLGVTQYLREVG